MFYYQRCNILRVAVGAIHINQAGLNNRIARCRDSIVPAGNDVGFEHVIIAENVLLSANRNQRTECAAAAVAICEVYVQPPEVPS